MRTKPKPASHPGDPAVEARQRGAYAGDNDGKQKRKKLMRGTAQPRAPPDNADEVDSDSTPVEYAADTIPMFCRKHHFSIAFFYKLKSQGKTPREMHVGRKRLITHQAVEEWQREREADAAAAAAKEAEKETA